MAPITTSIACRHPLRAQAPVAPQRIRPQAVLTAEIQESANTREGCLRYGSWRRSACSEQQCGNKAADEWKRWNSSLLSDHVLSATTGIMPSIPARSAL